MTDSVTLDRLKSDLLQRLAAEFPETEVYEGFLKEQIDREVDHGKLSVAVKEITTAPIGFSDYLGGTVDRRQYRQEYGVEGKVKIAFSLFFPKYAEENTANAFFLQLCNSLIFWDSYDFTELSCKEAEFLPSLQCFSLEMEGLVTLLLTQYEETAALSDVKVSVSPEKED